MPELASLLLYGSAVFTLIFSALGVALGQGIIGRASLRAGITQPAALAVISRNATIALAFVETPVIFALAFALILITTADLSAANALCASIAHTGILVCVGVIGLVVGLASALPASRTLFACARQPFFSDKAFLIMIIAMTFIQTPVVFGVIVAFLVHLQAATCVSVADGIRIAASALCVGFAAVGPTIGLGIFGGSACAAVGVNRSAYKQIFNFCMLSLPVIETPVLLALPISFLILGGGADPAPLRLVALVCAASCMAIGTLMPGISSGRTSSAACTQIGLHPECATQAVRLSLIAQGLIDTIAIYAFVVSIILILR